MKLEDQVTSLELSKKLCDLGVKQESLFFWTKTKYEGGKDFEYELHIAFIHCYSGWVTPDSEPTEIIDGNKDETYSAITVAELGEIIKPQIKEPIIEFGRNCGTRYWTFEEHFNGKYWICRFTCGDRIKEEVLDESEANARAKMLIYLLENKLI